MLQLPPRGTRVLASERPLLRSIDRLVRTSVQRHGVALTVKSLPPRVLRIRHEKGRLYNDPARTAEVADLCTDPISRGVKGRATYIAEVIRQLLAVTVAAENRC